MAGWSGWITPVPMLQNANDENQLFYISGTLHGVTTSSTDAWARAVAGTEVVVQDSFHALRAIGKSVEQNYYRDPGTFELTDTVEYASFLRVEVLAMDWADNLTRLPDLPDYLTALTEGVDYAQIPETTAYVEWETDSGTLLDGGYLIFQGFPNTGSGANHSDVDQDVTTSFMLNQVTNPPTIDDYPPDDWYPPVTTSLVTPVTLHNAGDGSAVTTTTGGGYEGEWDVKAMLDGTLMTVAITPDDAQPPDPTSLNDDLRHLIRSGSADFQAWVQYPRFRYWSLVPAPAGTLAAGPKSSVVVYNPSRSL